MGIPRKVPRSINTRTVLCVPGDPDLELLTSPAKSDTTIDQWSKAFAPKDKFKPLSVGRYVAKMMNLRFGLPPSTPRDKWLEKIIHAALASGRADERRQCLAVLNDAVIKVEALPTRLPSDH